MGGNQTIGGKPLEVIQLGATEFKGASIEKDDTKSIDLTKAKENWRYAKDSKFRNLWVARLKQLSPNIIVSNIPYGKEDMVKITSLRLGTPSKICKEVRRQMHL